MWLVSKHVSLHTGTGLSLLFAEIWPKRRFLVNPLSIRNRNDLSENEQRGLSTLRNSPASVDTLSPSHRAARKTQAAEVVELHSMRMVGLPRGFSTDRGWRFEVANV
jgi:hypothetical protein